MFAFEVNPCRYEVGFMMVSLHKTKISAYRAMRTYVLKEDKRHRQGWLDFGRSVMQRGSKPNIDHGHRIVPITVEE
jgi:hypothetical protein